MANTFKDLSGKTFGNWTVIKPVEKRIVGKQKHVWFYLCLCGCGIEKLVNSGNLRSGQSTNCGCIKNEKSRLRAKKPEGYAAGNRVLRDYKQRCIRENRIFNLSEDVFRSMIYSKCHYCGREGSNTVKRGPKSRLLVSNYNGIDRVDSSRGYVEGNCVPCCRTCNSIKRDFSVETFYEKVAILIKWGKDVLAYSKVSKEKLSNPHQKSEITSSTDLFSKRNRKAIKRVTAGTGSI